MKKMKFFATILAVMMALVACEEPFDPNQQKPGGDTPQTEYGKGTEAEPYTVAGVVKATPLDSSCLYYQQDSNHHALHL